LDTTLHSVVCFHVMCHATQGREMDTRTTVYKLKKETIYNLKMKASRRK